MKLHASGEDYLETVCLLSKLHTKQHIEIDLSMDDLDLTAAESKATYDEIKAYVLEKYGLKVSSLYISQVKRKCGLDVGQNYNLSLDERAKLSGASKLYIENVIDEFSEDFIMTAAGIYNCQYTLQFPL